MRAIFVCASLVALPAWAKPVPLIIDTDMDFDVDDVGALCAAHAMVDNGEAELLAVLHNVGYKEAISAVSVINRYYGRDDTLLGAFKGEFGANNAGKYIPVLHDNFESRVRDYSQVDDAVTVYRQALAGAEDHSVAISSIGFMQNLADLLSSPPDSISPLAGRDLVAQKVKLVAVMGGYYPQSDRTSEFNFDCGQNYMGPELECGGSTKAAVDNMPDSVQMVFLGFEGGVDVYSGGILTSCTSEDNPCRAAYIAYLGEGNDRSSWDPLTTMFAVRGEEAISMTQAGFGGRNNVTEKGDNYWVDGTASNQTYLVMQDKKAAGRSIDDLLCQKPLLPPGP